MRSSPRRLCLLTVAGVFLGVVGGGAAWALLKLIAIITNAALLQRWGTELPSFEHQHFGLGLLIAAPIGAAAVALLARWAPVIRGHGIPEAMEAVLERQSRVAPRVAIAKPLSSAIAIGTGGPFGAEGPIIVTGGAAGSLLGQLLSVTPSERKILLASGAAAGMAATFGSPLAAVVLAVELLLFEFSFRALAPLIAASGVAAQMHVSIFGPGPIFHVPQHHFAGLGELPVFVVLGLACGLLAVVICRGLFAWEELFRRLPIPSGVHPVVGALGVVAVGLVVPRALGVGYDAIDDALAGRLAVTVLLVLLVGKLLAWWVALASGTSGGTLAPILLVSSCFGGLFAALTHEVMPSLAVSGGAIAVVAMAATFGAATRAVFTSVVFAFELTRDYRALVPLMLAAVAADLVARFLLEHDIMTEKLVRRGRSVPRSYVPDTFAATPVRAVMTAEVITVDQTATVHDARALLLRHGHAAYPVVDQDGRCVGVVASRDLGETDAAADAPVVSVASRDVVSVPSGASVLDALQRMVDEDVDHLPVVDDALVVGICTRTDVLRARVRELESDRVTPGVVSLLGPRWPGARRASGPA